MEDRMGDKVKCRHILIKPKISIEVKEESINRLDSLAQAIRKGDIKFDEAAFRYSMDKSSMNNAGLVINPMTLSSKFDAESLPPAIYKVLNTLEVNEISKPFISTNEKGRDIIQFVKLISKTEPHKANLTDDYQIISEMFLEKKKNDMIQNWIAERQSKTYINIFRDGQDTVSRNCSGSGPNN